MAVPLLVGRCPSQECRARSGPGHRAGHPNLPPAMVMGVQRLPAVLLNLVWFSPVALDEAAAGSGAFTGG